MSSDNTVPPYVPANTDIPSYAPTDPVAPVDPGSLGAPVVPDMTVPPVAAPDSVPYMGSPYGLPQAAPMPAVAPDPFQQAPLAAPGGSPAPMPGYPVAAPAPYGSVPPAYPGAMGYGGAMPYAAVQPTNGLAIGGMVCGIVAIAFFWTTLFFGLWVGIVGAVLSAMGLSKANKGAGGRTQAIAGLICSLVAVVVIVILLAAAGTLIASQR